MKKLLIVVLVALCALPAFAKDEPAKAAAPAVQQAPAKTAGDVAKKGPEVVKLEGKVVITKEKGKRDVITFKTADAEYTLLPCKKLDELLKVADLANKTFEIEGHKVPSKSGKPEGILLKNFMEKKADATPAPAAAPAGK